MMEDGVVTHALSFRAERHDKVAAIKVTTAIGWAGRQLSKSDLRLEVAGAACEQHGRVSERTAQRDEVRDEPSRRLPVWRALGGLFAMVDRV
jgi:hypothetical protein